MFIYILYMSFCYIHMYIHICVCVQHMCIVPKESRTESEFPETGDRDGYELLSVLRIEPMSSGRATLESFIIEYCDIFP